MSAHDVWFKLIGGLGVGRDAAALAVSAVRWRYSVSAFADSVMSDNASVMHCIVFVIVKFARW